MTVYYIILCYIILYYDFILYDGIVSYKFPECENYGYVGEYSHFLVLRRSMLRCLGANCHDVYN